MNAERWLNAAVAYAANIKVFNKISDMFKHVVFVKLLILLLCISFCVTLMQAGSLFLVDYIPSNQAAVRHAYQQQLVWMLAQDRAVQGIAASGHAPQPEKEYQGMPFTAAEIQQQQRQLNDIAQTLTTGLEVLPGSVSLAEAFQQLRQAYAQFNPGKLPAIAPSSPAIAQVEPYARVIKAYQQLAAALKRDVELKQSVITLLQLMSFALLMAAIAAIVLHANRLLIQRMDAMHGFIPAEMSSQRTEQEADEFARVERMVYELSARLEGFKAENEWFNQTNSEHLRRMLRAQDFLHKFMALVNNTTLTETALRKILYLLERALNVNNVAMIFTEDDAGISPERLLFSHHKPGRLQDELFHEVTTASSVSFSHTTEEGVRLQCLAVGFSSLSGALGVLKVEADAEHLFDDTEVRLLEITAQLLSMMMGFQGREQESRRVALLEERAAIARELHDSLAQSLSFMKIQIARLQSAIPQERNTDKSTDVQEIVSELQQGLDNAYRELRELLATFRVHMDVRGLNVAVQSAIDEFRQRSNLAISLDNRLVNCRLTVNEEFHILHVIREALSNVVRHANASNAMVSLVLQPSGDLMVTVDDDGIGYTQGTADDHADGLKHYGQSIMQERAYSLGGSIAVLRRRTGGTRIRLLFTPKLPQ